MKNRAYIYIIILSLIAVKASFAESTNFTMQSIKKTVADEATLFDNNKEITHIDSLANYIEYAISNNQKLQSLYFKWAASVENIQVVSSLTDPQFSVGYFVENVETRVGPQNKKLSLKQKFPWFGTLGSKKRATFEKSNIRYQSYNSYKQKLIYDVKKSYYLYWLLKRQILISNDNFLLLELWESIARTKYKTAQSNHPDLIKIQITLAKLEDNLIELHNSIAPMETHLRTILNLPQEIEMHISKTFSVEKENIDEAELFSLAEQNNPELLKTIHAIERDKALKSLASKNTRPSFMLGVDYIDIGEAVNSSSFESGKDAWVVSASISIPLWFSKNKAKKRSSEYALQSSNLQYEQQKLELTDKLTQILFTYHDSYRKVKLYRDGLIPKAEQSIHVSLKGYQADNVNITTLLDSQKELLDFQFKLDQSKVKFALQKAALNRVITIQKY